MTKITELPAYKRLEAIFAKKLYKQGVKDETPIIYCKDFPRCEGPLTLGHYISAVSYGSVEFDKIPEKFRTRELFLHSLSGCHKDVLEYAQKHAGTDMFDYDFFRDAIETDYYNLTFERNIFSWMPLEFIDEQMVMCAMFRAVNMRYADRRGECEGWFYSVYERKPEVLTREIYILGARCFASKRGNSRFLKATPKEFLDEEYYLAMCMENDGPVMEDVPQEYLTNNFLVTLLNDNYGNIQCFTEEALERCVMSDSLGMEKIWKTIVKFDGYQIDKIPLNDERIEYFLSLYGKDSSEYECSFKENYKEYLRKKENKPQPKNGFAGDAAMFTLALAFSGCDGDSAIEAGNSFMHNTTNRKAMLPIASRVRVPENYCKKFDKEEYLVEIYKKYGISVGDEADYDFYHVILPEDIKVDKADRRGEYTLKKGDEVLLHYYDYGSFYDREVFVAEINVEL